jgi:hypothetical protein
MDCAAYSATFAVFPVLAVDDFISFGVHLNAAEVMLLNLRIAMKGTKGLRYVGRSSRHHGSQLSLGVWFFRFHFTLPQNFPLWGSDSPP